MTDQGHTEAMHTSILNPANFPPPTDRETTVPPGTTFILAADLSHRSLTPTEKHGLHTGTHILITADRSRSTPRISTNEEIEHARQLVAAAKTEELRKATMAAIRAERASQPGQANPTSQGGSSKAQWRAARTPEQIQAERKRDAERKRAARAAKASQGGSSC